MKNNKLAKALLLVLCAILLVCASVMGTLAYLTDKAEVNNTFTVGNVLIDMNETDTDGDGNTKENEYHLIPGSKYIKDPVITVDSTSESCWLFIKVENGIEDIEDTSNPIAEQIENNGWTALAGEDGVYYRTHGKGGITSYPTFGEFTIKTTWDGSGTYSSSAIKVTAYAVQYENLTDVNDAWTAAQGATTK